MTAGARRGFRERFRRLVDPECALEPEERERRAERAMRAHMLTLSEKSARARRRVPRNEDALMTTRKKATRAIVTPRVAMPAAIDADRPHPTRSHRRDNDTG